MRGGWNKGLTKETDKRVERNSVALKEFYNTEQGKKLRKLSTLKQWKILRKNPEKLKLRNENVSKALKGKPFHGKAFRFEIGKKRPEHSKLMKERYEKGLWMPPILNPEFKEKVRLGLFNKQNKKYPKISASKKEYYKIHRHWNFKPCIKRNCLTCNKEFFVKRCSKKKFCSYKCSSIHNWQNPEYRERMIKVMMKALAKRPTKLEHNGINFISKFNLPIKYVGDGSLIIGGKNPDYVESNGKKICFEIGNKIEKSLKREGRDQHSWQEYEQQRIEHFKKHGWKCLVIWEDELQNERLLLDKIQNFIR